MCACVGVCVCVVYVCGRVWLGGGVWTCVWVEGSVCVCVEGCGCVCVGRVWTCVCGWRDVGVCVWVEGCGRVWVRVVCVCVRVTGSCVPERREGLWVGNVRVQGFFVSKSQTTKGLGGRRARRLVRTLEESV